MHAREEFLPVSREDMLARGWYYYDFLLVTGDAYVDHPSFGTAVISRTLEKAGFRVAILSQPDWHGTADFLAMGKPRLGVLINSGNIDSMVAHYSVAKRRRQKDSYTPGGLPGKRPDRAVIVYANRAREAFPGVPIVIGGIEASLRRFAHYDYWDDAVRRSILVDSGADLLSFGMGERSMTEIARRLKKGEKPETLRDIRGTCFLAKDPSECVFPDALTLPSFEDVRDDKEQYARAAFVQQNENDFARGHALIQPTGGRYLIQNPPALPLEGKELDAVFDLPYARYYHPDYEALGGVAAIEEVRFSIIHNRGCFGSCNFCALALHQGRYVTARSTESVVREAKLITADPDFKGYIHDVGGPTANFDHPACAKQKTQGACPNRQCLFPTPCPNLNADESGYLDLLRQLRALPGVKKVFIRSGIRFDYMLKDPRGDFFAELVRYHVSGQLKVAPEHISPRVLHYMGKPFADVYDHFCRKYYALSEKYGKEQYLVPYLMSSHPGSGLREAIDLACYLRENRLNPDQVQDFYPTPGTLSTAMYYTGLDPRDMTPVFVARDPEDKAMQRALLQSGNPKNHALVRKALHLAGREELIGWNKHCLVPPEKNPGGDPDRKRGNKTAFSGEKPRSGGKNTAKFQEKPARGGKPGKSGKSAPAGKDGGGRNALPAPPRGKNPGKPGRQTPQSGKFSGKPGGNSPHSGKKRR